MVKKIKIPILFLFLFPLIALLNSCDLLLGAEPDTSPQGILKSLWEDFNNIYAYLDIRMSHNLSYNDWYDVYHNNQNGYARKVWASMSDDSLFSVCESMLKQLNDPHVVLHKPGDIGFSYTPGSREYASASNIEELLLNRGKTQYYNFLYGLFKDEPNIGYINIFDFVENGEGSENNNWGKAIDNIINELADTKAIVLDIRGNRGGHIYVLEYIAARFASEKKEYLKSSMKKGPNRNDYDSPITHINIPSHTNYTKPVILLTNMNTVSAAERFTLALRTQKHVTHTGTPTRGALSIRVERSMVNGWIYSISPEKITDMNGKIYEGIGISPNDEYIVEYGTNDAQIKKAVELAVNFSE